MEDEALLNKLVANAEALEGTTMTIGGNAALMGLQFAAEGFQVSLAAKVGGNGVRGSTLTDLLSGMFIRSVASCETWLESLWFLKGHMWRTVTTACHHHHQLEQYV